MIERHVTVFALACMASATVISAPQATKPTAKPATASAAAKPAVAVVADLSKPYTLMADAAKIIDAGKTAPGDFMFKAALAADWAGDGVKSRDFLAYFLDKEKGNTPEVRRALVRLCLAGGSQKYYERYLACSPHDLDALYIGLKQFERFVNEGKSRDCLAQLQLLLDTFPTGPEFDAVVRSMHWAVHDTHNIFGISDGKLALKALTRCVKWQMTPRMATFLNRYGQRGMFHQEFFDLYKSNRTQKWTKDMLERLANSATTPEDMGVEMVRQILERYGIDRKKPEGYLNRFGRLSKQSTWMSVITDSKNGKYPEAPTGQLWAANSKLQAWVNDYRGKKFDGKAEEAMKRAAEVFKGHQLWEFEDIKAMRAFCDGASRIAQGNPAAAKLYPFEGFAQWAFERPYHDTDYNMVTLVMRAYEAAGNLKGGFDRILKAADNAGTAQGMASFRLGLATIAGKENGGKTYLTDAWYDWDNKKFYPPATERDRLAWATMIVKRFAKAPVPELIRLPDLMGVNWDAYWRCEQGARDAKREMTDAEKKYRDSVDAILQLAGVFSYPNGHMRIECSWDYQVPIDVPLRRAVKKDPKGSTIPLLAASAIKLNRGEWRDIVTVCTNLMANDRVEIAYLLSSRHRDIDKVAELQKIRTEAAGLMPGLYPVNDKDPAYPLYVAADALARNNPERAWTLLSANTKTFDKNPMRYQPQFALWALEQYRKVRGPNDALRDRAWEHVETLLQKESAFPAEIAAGLFLLRAEIAEDRLQYEIAHAGYQALRNHAQYKLTKAGRQAMFKDVDLLLTMGSADSASQTAEQWITVPEDDVRAQGHYVLAKIAFQRKDYDETRKELDKVFEIDFTHAEARLLQGEWKLATNYEVDDTQVLLGDLADRSAIRPGQPLSISVQDKNLAVAGGGSSIPVVVTTSSGKDAEKVLLYPGTRDPSLFRGSIDTTLGLAKPHNSTLELCGDDTVSYRIEPAYLEGRGLPVDKPKDLTVVDDADLLIGTGKENESIKPGLPLRVRLVDRDRSRKNGVSSVEVEVMTTSGDRIPSAVLKEKEPCSGIFEGEIPTALPPPRAFASDSTAAMGPQDLISKNRNAAWQSLEDGEKPKFVGVDTMNSHLVQTAAIEMGSPETIARLRLFGTLYGEEMLLGTYPTESAETRKGIHMLSTASGARNRTDFMRELSKKIVTPFAVEKWGVHRTLGGHNGMRHLVRGTVYVPEDTLLKLRIKPITPDTKNEKDTLRRMTMEFFIDGTRVLGGFSEWDQAAKTRPRTVLVDKGIHDFEIFATTVRATDSFEICDEKDSGELVSLPEDWTDEKAHPELLARLTDKCKIVRSKTGYSAQFTEPERLRTLRWEFSDFTGKSVSASKLFVTDKGGKQIIPVEHDYTEALGNNTLEVAPGDTITVTYEDNVTSSGRSRAVEKQIGSAFFNGEIEFLCEELVETRNGKMESQMFPAYRIAPGDTVFVKVTDQDLDVTKGIDKVKIVVEATSGKKIIVYASERGQEEKDGSVTVDPRASGVFYAQIRTAEPTSDGSKLPEGTIELKEGEGLVAAYKDEDNTDPGIPTIRKASLAALPNDENKLMLGNTWGERGPDKSPEGHVKLLTIRRRNDSAAATEVWRTSYYGQFSTEGEGPALPLVTPETEIPVSFYAPTLIRHAGSTVTVKIATKSELDAAEAEGRDVEWSERTLRLTMPNSTTKIKTATSVLSLAKKKLPDTLYGVIDLYSSAAEERAAEADDEDSSYDEDQPEPIDLKAGDELIVRYMDEDGATLGEAKAKIGTTAWIGLADATYEANNPAVHLGESFHLMVIDPDRDTTDEQDEVTVKVSSKRGVLRELTLRETMPRSGVFTCPLTPSIETEEPAPAAGAQPAQPAQVAEAASADDGEEESEEEASTFFPSSYGDELTFTYEDELVGLTGTAGVRTVVGHVRPGSDGTVRSYSKRFRDADQAVLVQFRLAECLFEMAKDFRKLKNTEKSAGAIADGRKILEAALRDYPNTSHAAEGEFLLANLYEQLAEEERQARKQREKDGEDLSNEPDKADPLFREAAARFSSILSACPEGEYAARSQYHKALCLERLGDFARAGEEYVKMTYLFPDSPLVGDASVRLASYYYSKEQRYDIASKIYTSFRNRFPAHPQAPNALFMGGQCLVKQAETLAEDKKNARGKAAMIADAYKDAVSSFVSLVDNYKDIQNKELLAQGLYWAGDVSFRLKDYPNAYIYLKRTTFEYPESKWARYARGMLLQEAAAFEEVAQ